MCYLSSVLVLNAGREHNCPNLQWGGRGLQYVAPTMVQISITEAFCFTIKSSVCRAAIIFEPAVEGKYEKPPNCLKVWGHLITHACTPTLSFSQLLHPTVKLEANVLGGYPPNNLASQTAGAMCFPTAPSDDVIMGAISITLVPVATMSLPSFAKLKARAPCRVKKTLQQDC